MPNSLNYGSPLTTTLLQRPTRIIPNDLRFFHLVDTPVIFGTSNTDVVELWIYNSNGSLAGHINLEPSNNFLRQATFIDQTGAFETINIDLHGVADELFIQPGRYAMVANFFRNEVGSEEGNKLYIANISDDRTELRLVPIDQTEAIKKEIYEFIAPSVPRQYAKGLIDQVFGTTLEAPPEDVITTSKIAPNLEAIIPGTVDRIGYSLSIQEYFNLYGLILVRTYKQALDNMAQDVFNYNIQQIELEAYIEAALHSVVYAIKQSGEHDPRFSLVP